MPEKVSCTAIALLDLSEEIHNTSSDRPSNFQETRYIYVLNILRLSV
ncbi:MAG: hypothetical protein KME52_23285 [Desmonostoc geniculatum HA4340-LM1]|nr:hypothetical protein [Desmonostoc geniculatum HA4340-LM1]